MWAAPHAGGQSLGEAVAGPGSGRCTRVCSPSCLRGPATGIPASAVPRFGVPFTPRCRTRCSVRSVLKVGQPEGLSTADGTLAWGQGGRPRTNTGGPDTHAACGEPDPEEHACRTSGHGPQASLRCQTRAALGGRGLLGRRPWGFSQGEGRHGHVPNSDLTYALFANTQDANKKFK